MCLILASLFAPSGARATVAAYAGIDIVIDPYGQTDIGDLQSAATTLASGCGTTGTATPFCVGPSGVGYVSGLFLRVRWCSWELANVTLSNTLAKQSCYYVVDPTNAGTAISQLPTAMENVSPCAGLATMPQYDTCTVAQSGVNSQLYTTLGYIATINQARIGAKLPALQLTLGLEAGASSAMRFIYNPSAQIATQPTTIDLGTSGAGGNYCVRQPNFWDPNYIMAFYTALDNLITDVQAYNSSFNKAILNVKVAPVNLFTGEFSTGARSAAIKTATDSQAYQPANTKLIACPYPGQSASGAYRLLALYNSQINAQAAYPDCRFYATYSQATECLLGLVIGNVRGTLKVATLYSAIESVDTNNANALGDVDCGADSTGDPSSSGNCLVQGTAPSTTSDQWTLYYLFYDIDNLLISQTPNQTVAWQAANWAFSQVPGAGKPLKLTAGQIGVEWTGLQPDTTTVNKKTTVNYNTNYFADANNAPNNSIGQVPCALNNTATGTGAPQFTYVLDGTSTSVTGIGTVLGWQEDLGTFGQDLCTVAVASPAYTGETDYHGVLYSGTANGGQYIEVLPDVAFGAYFADCSPDLNNALSFLQGSTSPPGTCVYN